MQCISKHSFDKVINTLQISTQGFYKLMDWINIKGQENSESSKCMKFRITLFQGNNWASLPNSQCRAKEAQLHKSTLIWSQV
jgi:hypothetical protein